MAIDAKNLYGPSMSQPSPNDEMNFDRNVKLEDKLNNFDDSDFGYFVEVDICGPDETKEKTKNFHFVLRIKKYSWWIYTIYKWNKKQNSDT